MRTRLVGLIAAAVLAALGAGLPVAQAAVPAIGGQMCVDGGGTVEYESVRGSWICVDGKYDGKPID
ncbi:hypothetical protein ACFCYM_28295 [Streptomyces sp. NPDC056254]|uniref:hypothetical protein n=1 Tax=unclassified Streptomyces TaxID=2593676 RepID=UPI0004AB7F40|nr:MULTISPECIES: hypothetical protein [unclassified Streptomyces]KJK44177.1 hypothetical protein UK14_29035 [Streptomyces sp. NRRL F-4428]